MSYRRSTCLVPGITAQKRQRTTRTTTKNEANEERGQRRTKPTYGTGEWVTNDKHATGFELGDRIGRQGDGRVWEAWLCTGLWRPVAEQESKR